MKKLILTATAIVGAAMGAYAQGVVFFNDTAYPTVPGYVVTDVNGHLSSSTANYVATPNFTAALYQMPGNVTSLSSLTAQPDAYGYLTPAQLATDGFTLVGTTLGGSANLQSDGYFDGGTSTLTGTAGGYSLGSSSYTSFDVLALVCWTGTSANLAAAITANADVGIFAFVNPIGPGGSDPHVPELSGWPTTLSPANTANDGFPELILAPVPEPCTLAIATLGGLSLLGLRRKKA
jgi:hypothetical protein